MVVQSELIGFAGTFARWIGRTSFSQESTATPRWEIDCFLGNSVVCATATEDIETVAKLIETVAKLDNAIRKTWFDKLLIDLRLVCRKSIPILCSNHPTNGC